MGGQQQKSEYVEYFGRQVEVGKRGNVIKEVNFNSRKAEIQYIAPTMEELRSGIWIGARPLASNKFLKAVGYGYNPQFDKLVPQFVHAALLIEGNLIEIVGKDKQNGSKVKITLRSLANEVLEEFNWHLILKKHLSTIQVNDLVGAFQDYTYNINSNVQEKKINCQSFCVESIKKIFGLNKDNEAYDLIHQGVHQSYNWRDTNLL